MEIRGACDKEAAESHPPMFVVDSKDFFWTRDVSFTVVVSSIVGEFSDLVILELTGTSVASVLASSLLSLAGLETCSFCFIILCRILSLDVLSLTVVFFIRFSGSGGDPNGVERVPNGFGAADEGWPLSGFTTESGERSLVGSRCLTGIAAGLDRYLGTGLARYGLGFVSVAFDVGRR